MHSVVSRRSPWAHARASVWMRDDHASFFTDGGDNMAKIQIITAMTMDGFLPTTEESLMQWVLNDAKGFPHTGTSVASTA